MPVSATMRFKLHAAFVAAAAVVGLYARPAAACAACFAASNAGARLGYFVSTAILTLTPLFIMGAMVTYVAVKYKRAGKQDQPGAGGRG